MDKILKHTIIRLLHKYNITTVDYRALELFIEVFHNYMFRLCSTIKKITTHSSRTKTTLLDFRNFIINKIESFDEFPFLNEDIIEDMTICTQLAPNVDKFLHVYEFMPSFPPLHTFKETSVKENRIRSRARDVKDRIEQRNQIVDNLIELIGQSDNGISFANYTIKYNLN